MNQKWLSKLYNWVEDILLTLLIAFVSSSCSVPNKEKIVENWPNGHVKYKVIYSNPKDTTSYDFIKYYESGEIELKGKFVNGKKNGIENGWFENKKSSLEELYVDGELKEYTYWHENGSLSGKGIVYFIDTVTCFDSTSNMNYQLIGTYGNSKYWYGNGKIESEMIMLDSNRALSKQWDSTGKLINHETLVRK